MMRSIAIDLVPIQPGKGGTGSGIWTYARELVAHLNEGAGADAPAITILMTREQQACFPNPWKIRTVLFPNVGKCRVTRLFWVHVWLPLWCAWHRIKVLHKLATETPVFCPCARVTTVHDFYHVVMKEQGTGHAGGTRAYFQWMSKWAARRSAAIITDSEAVRREIQDRFAVPGDSVHVVPLGVTPSIQRTNPKPERPFTVLYLAKLMPYKGQMEALRAWAHWLRMAPDRAGQARLILHGFGNDPAYEAALDAFILAEGLSSGVTRRPYHADATLDELYAGADVLLFLSRYEGFGLPVIEAQAHGIPVVCSDLPVLREVGGDAARFVDGQDEESVAVALDDLYRNEALRAELSERGRINAARYRWSETARQTLEIYRMVAP